jgi:predicted AAA+ superfamily ATPase
MELQVPIIQRFYDNLEGYIQPGKVLILYGARRVGKTTLLNNYLKTTTFKYRLDNGDNIRLQQLLGSQDFQQITDYVSGYELIAIDEAQQVPKIGTALKIIVDQHPQMRVIATGSSSFDLSNQLGEPLTGRKQTLTLYPVAQLEMGDLYNRYELKQQLEEFVVFGSYPEIVTAENRQAKIDLLHDLAGSHLFKDLLALDRVRSSSVLLNLVKLLAFQVGSEVSLNELATHLSVDVKTVGRYLDLLEKSFVIIRVGGFSRNLRGEVSQKQKYYFLDNGIRNAVINQFNGLGDRNDIGQLWENFVVTERLKKREYRKIYAGMYFWRTYSQKEIDLVEEREGKLFGYEIKWSKTKEVSAPGDWLTNYENASFEVITPDNYLDFVG